MAHIMCVTLSVVSLSVVLFAWGCTSISVHVYVIVSVLVYVIVSVLGLSVVLNDKWFTDRGHGFTTATVRPIVVCHCQACGLLPDWLGWMVM